MFKVLCYILATLAGLLATAFVVLGNPLHAAMNAVYTVMFVMMARD